MLRTTGCRCPNRYGGREENDLMPLVFSESVWQEELEYAAAYPNPMCV